MTSRRVPDRLEFDLDVWAAGEQFGEGDLGLHTGGSRTEALVDAVREGEDLLRVTQYIP
ncbi:hypothetical protein [Nocardia vinacea]|uniref:hypothetical protein n=1 Tax=Nocardia vinacea TaxID=96468 RepID=UPI003F4CC52D